MSVCREIKVIAYSLYICSIYRCLRKRHLMEVKGLGVENVLLYGDVSVGVENELRALGMIVERI